MKNRFITLSAIFAAMLGSTALTGCTTISNPFAHLLPASQDPAHPAITPLKPTVRLAILPQDEVVVGKSIVVEAKLNTIETLTLVSDDDLEGNAPKLQLLLLDPTFTDFQRVSPQLTNIPGVYNFRFTPKTGASYHVWAEVTPKATHMEEFAMAELGAHKTGELKKMESHSAVFNGYNFALTFNTAPVAGSESTGKITATDKNGKPVELSAAGNAIIGVYDDYHTVVHATPVPAQDAATGKQELDFNLPQVQDGFLKLFAQVRIDGKDVLVPFVINIAKTP